MRHAGGLARNHAAALSRRHLRPLCKSGAANGMNWSVLRLLYVHEMRMLLRARRTVVLAILLPLVIMPLMLYAQKYSYQRREQQLISTTYRYAVTGPLADRVRTLIAQTRASLPPETETDFDRLREYKIVELQTSNAQDSLDKNQINFYIETFSGE